MNANKVIIYDDNCPMCQAYTRGFVEIGILPENGRQQFSCAPAEVIDNLDLDRARHEIPLYDTVTGETIYGKQALFFLLESRFPMFAPLFRNAVFQAAVQQLYQIITYNRRIIAGSSAPETGFDCAPDFNWFYRSLYIVLAILATILMLFLLQNGDFAFQKTLIWAFALLPILFTTQKMDWLGHWATIGIIASALTAFVGNFTTIFLVEGLDFAAFLAFFGWKRWGVL